MLKFNDKIPYLTCKKNQILFNEGSEASGVYFIKKGKVKVFVNDAKGNEKVLYYATNGFFLGLLSLLNNNRHNSNAVACENTIVLYVNKDVFIKIIKELPVINQQILLSLNNILNNTGNKLTQQRGNSDAPEKMSPQLLYEISVISKYINQEFLRKNTSVRLSELESFFDLCENKSFEFFKKNQILFLNNTKPLGVYYIKQGSVKLSRIDAEKKEKIIRIVSPNEFIGVRSIIRRGNFPYTATAIDNCATCFIPEQEFLNLIKKHPDFSCQLIITLCNLIDEAENKINSFADKSAKERIAETLLMLNNTLNIASDVKENIIKISREDLANLTGTVKETVIRCLSKFKEQNLIAVKGRSIKLLDVNELSNICNKI